MRCERLQELLPGYLEGDLRGRLNQRISDHLDGCERCRQSLSAQQRALRALDAGRHSVSIDLWADFSRRLQAQSPPPPPRWRVLLQPAMAVAAAAAVAIIAGFASRPEPAQPLRTVGTGGTMVARILPQEEATGTSGGRSLQLARPRPSFSIEAAPISPGRAERFPIVSAESQRPMDGRRQPERVRRPRHHRSAFIAAHPPSLLRRGVPGPQPAHRPVLLAGLANPQADNLQPGLQPDHGPRRTSIPGTLNAEQGISAPSSVRPEGDRHRSGDPLRVALALASAEQDTASDKMGGEVLRMAREVARLGGESGGAAGTESGGENSILQGGVATAGT